MRLEGAGQVAAVDGFVPRRLRAEGGGCNGHGRAISHYTTIQLDAVGSLALDADLAIAAIGCTRDRCIQLELYTRGTV